MESKWIRAIANELLLLLVKLKVKVTLEQATNAQGGVEV